MIGSKADSSSGDLVLYHDLSCNKLFPNDLKLPTCLEEMSCGSSSILFLDELSSDLIKIGPKKLVANEPSRNSLRNSPHCRRLISLKGFSALLLSN